MNTPDQTVTVEIAGGRAVYHNGQQRTGTIEHVPLTTALNWLHRRWADYCWHT